MFQTILAEKTKLCIIWYMKKKHLKITMSKEGVAIPMLIFPKGVADKIEKSKLQNSM